MIIIIIIHFSYYLKLIILRTYQKHDELPVVIPDNCAFYFLMTLLSPLAGLLLQLFFFKTNFLLGSRLATLSLWVAFISTMIGWILKLPFCEKNEFAGFIVNEISWIMATLILFVSAIVHHFSLSYLSGDRKYSYYFLSLTSLTLSTLLMVASDNIALLISFWLTSNLLLVLLMIHKFDWLAAKHSGILALKTFLMGLFFLILGAGILAYESNSLSIQIIIKNSPNLPAPERIVALLFIILAALTQSGAWPFHKWLISSLNSPTPVSALMHAGLVNGGGFLLVRFAPIFLSENLLLDLLFLFGMITLVLGGIWKLIQNSIKGMLACSTMTQIGFMIMQCGLGLFPAALAHLCWHGLFKSFLFLRSGSTLKEKGCKNENRTSSVVTFLLSSFCGFFGGIGFIYGSNLLFIFEKTTSLLVLFAWVAASQLAHTLLEKKRSFFLICLGSSLCLIIGFIYGITIHLIEQIVEPLGICKPQTIDPLHILGILFIICIWLILNLKPLMKYEGSVLWKKFYIHMLNASQPHPNTISSNRNDYKF
jgi:NAD(P)H-quinone oxidoreductase subunit 5